MKAFKSLLHVAVMGIGAIVVILGILVDLAGMFLTIFAVVAEIPLHEMTQFVPAYVAGSAFAVVAAIVLRFVVFDGDKRSMTIFLLWLSPFGFIIFVGISLVGILIFVIPIVRSVTDPKFFPKFIRQVMMPVK
jgi:hypothetical protein